jgi:hypothetical protein
MGDVHSRLQSGFYKDMENEVPYPDAKKIKDEEWAKFIAEPHTLPPNLSHEQVKQWTKDREAEHHAKVKQTIDLLRKAHGENLGRVTEQVFHDTAAFYDLLDHPKARKLWSIAWAFGHSYGYSEVVSYFGDMAELLK